MKNLLLVSFLLFGSITILQAQEQGDSRLHVLGQYGLRLDEPGIGLGWEYFFAPQFGLMPSYTQLFPAVGRAGNFSADLRYYLSKDKSQVYVVTGYSLTSENPQPGTAGTKPRNPANLLPIWPRFSTREVRIDILSTVDGPRSTAH
jgi:hypothetical protein